MVRNSFLAYQGKTGGNKDKENHEIRAKALDSFGFASSRLLQKCEFFYIMSKGLRWVEPQLGDSRLPRQEILQSG